MSKNIRIFVDRQQIVVEDKVIESLKVKKHSMVKTPQGKRILFWECDGKINALIDSRRNIVLEPNNHDTKDLYDSLKR